MDNSVKARVLTVLNEIFGQDGDDLGLNAKIGTDIALTSLDRMTLFIALEDEFDRMIPQKEVEALETVGDVVSFIEEQVAT